MFALSSLKAACYELLGVPTEDPARHDIWLGGFDFFIQYVHCEMKKCTLFNKDDFENVAAGLRDYYHSNLQNVRVLEITSSLSSALTNRVDTNKCYVLDKILHNIAMVGWDDNCAAIQLCYPFVGVVVYNGQLRRGALAYDSEDLSTCTIITYEEEPTRAENGRELAGLKEQDRLSILLLAYNRARDEEVLATCKTDPKLYSWAQKIDIPTRRDEFRGQRSWGLLSAVAYLERSYCELLRRTHTYLNVVERAQLTEILLDYLKSRTELTFSQDDKALTDKINELTAFYNRQPHRTANPICKFTGFELLKLSWTDIRAYLNGFPLQPDGSY